MGTMLDTTSDPRHAFSGLTMDAVAAYANGSYANYRQAKAEFPHLHVLEMDVTGQGIGNTGDFEAKDMPYSRAGSWAKSRINAGIHRPVLYFSVSNWRAIMQSLKASELTRNSVRIWTAHYTGTPHLCSSACGFGVTGSADATQWGSSDYPKTLHPPYTEGEAFWDPPTIPKRFTLRIRAITSTCRRPPRTSSGQLQSHERAAQTDRKQATMIPYRQPILPGDSGSDVLAVKHTLRRMGAKGHSAMTMNDHAGEAFVETLKVAQREGGIGVDGKYGKESHQLIAPHFSAEDQQLYSSAKLRVKKTPAVPSGNAAASAKRVLQFRSEGRYHADNAGDLNDIQATAEGRAVLNRHKQLVHVDARVMNALIYLIEKGHSIGTFAICSDHGWDSEKGHSGGLAVDISTIDGHAISNASARALVIKVDHEMHNAGALKPRQLITGGVGEKRDAEISSLSIPGADSYYTTKVMNEHCNHIHVGY